MADATLAGEAAARALGWPPGLLMDAINHARRAAAGELVATDPLVAVR
jgi:hypothetical protein